VDTKPTPDGGLDPPDVLGALADLVARAGQGDEDALPALREALRAPELWRHAAGVAAAARATWAAHLAAEGFAAAVRESEIGVLPATETGAGPPGPEELLGEYIAVCRLPGGAADPFAGCKHGAKPACGERPAPTATGAQTAGASATVAPRPGRIACRRAAHERLRAELRLCQGLACGDGVPRVFGLRCHRRESAFSPQRERKSA
jgi:hypothetical protein